MEYWGNNVGFLRLNPSIRTETNILIPFFWIDDILSQTCIIFIRCSFRLFIALFVFTVTVDVSKIYKTIILPVVLYGCESLSLTLREESRLRVFENRILRRIFGPKRNENGDFVPFT